ncbi:Rv1157c family protein [Antrihabitans cavernicola]|uniref:Secreted protein n=1 Tax=Antrihabitans cavernicola TaxID=2495913 RepID=A0A5A7S8Y3_9NOCA|nr:hypothetical protein [Spelaeibacter cavernicola]KAA0022618.1 hypothetical protein FOY51_13090 [Spelaeibacter cavernicola]
MLRTRGTRKVVTALAIAAAAAIVAPTTAAADQAPTPPPAVPQGIPVDALASLAPAIIGAVAGPADIADGPQASLLDQAKQILATADLPPQIKTTLESVITFLDGSGGGGPALPKNGPTIAQFLYPTIGKGCISDTADSVGTALAVPGPGKLPPPGPGAGQAGFVFTALGTKPATPDQANPMTVTWLNLDNRRSATQNLTDAAKINPDGPATLSAIADTGPGRVVAVVSGSLTTAAADAAPRTCTFLPTVGMFAVA